MRAALSSLPVVLVEYSDSERDEARWAEKRSITWGTSAVSRMESTQHDSASCVPPLVGQVGRVRV